MKPFFLIFLLIVSAFFIAPLISNATFQKAKLSNGWEIHLGDTLRVISKDKYEYISNMKKTQPRYLVIQNIEAISDNTNNRFYTAKTIDSIGEKHKVALEDAAANKEIETPELYSDRPFSTNGDPVFISSMGWPIKSGDKILIGEGSTTSGDFKYIRRNEASLFRYTGENRGGVNASNAAPMSIAGHTFNVIRIEQRGSEKSGYVYYGIITVKLGMVVRHEIDLERAIKSGEIVAPDQYKPNKELKNDSTFSIADELAKFKKLLEDGTITQEEYEVQKKKLLSK